MMRHGAAVGQCVFSSNSLFGLMCWFGSSVRMQVCFLLLLIQLHITEGCWLKGNGETEEITAYTGGSVLLPCSCTDLHRKPETFIWMKTKNEYNWVQISPESDQYKERYQLVNDHSSGNLSLLISHLTEEDGGVYRCSVKGGEYRDIRLTVKGCRLKGNGETEEITAYTGGSVLLPCSCTDLHIKPETFTWEKNTNGNNWVQISPESDQYKERYQLVNDHSSGNLSLLISHLTEEDGGDYRCSVKGGEYRYIRLTVKGAPTRPSSSTPVITTTSPPSSPDTTINICTAVGVLLLLLILGGVIYWKHRDFKVGAIATVRLTELPYLDAQFGFAGGNALFP
ncbi:junctional adhesion molecule-like [Hemibagrus wyckioides]|uniref:junctional adhesion molecule-like n=1 Tax=Hemibagrus wyckioides TaxID=337641 RepID=UPI00266DA510|nr:junctional adhesion molecule-like [Hemibagrus wyckioides]